MNEAKKELWDIYNRERGLTGRKHRRGEPMQDGDYHMVVHVCIFNSQNELLIQQRQPFKHGWPNLWDLTVGGSAVAGDTSWMAAEREVSEELGISIDLSGQRPHFTVNFNQGFDDYYIVKKDIDLSTIKLQKEEVQRVRWASKEEVLKMQAEGTMIPYWFTEQLFSMGDTYDAHQLEKTKITVGYATNHNFASWMSLVEIVKGNFPGLESKEELEHYQQVVRKNMERKSAICALDGKIVVGILLFSKKLHMLSFMAVHPEYRRRGIGRQMVELMKSNMSQAEEIVVETFREGDEKGTAARAFYQSLGFEAAELVNSQVDYPTQRFYWKRKNENESQ